MTLFKCKMCGGALEIQNNETVAECAYCGTKQTLPKLDDEKRANLYDRANHFRRNNEFDKAMGIYEQILNEDSTDAEAYWSLVLCRYGIEYVEDPSSHKRVPTVNRAQFTSIFDDDNYKSALKNSDSYQKAIYEKEAKTINEIQKGILAISQKEEPFDVFICYKETDNNGRRTPDSVLANDLYHQLTQEGFRVFFARITLEDKLGSAYEPYIFAALNSAKVMVVLGTKPEFFNAVWVKNEWSRFLTLIKNGAKKMLIPAYKDMDPYDLPEEFSHLQAQDMSKLGFMQDLIRGIKKIAQVDTPKATVVKETVISGGNANTAPLLKRAFMFLEDKEWNSADEYCEKVLDIDPENALAYLGKLLSELRVRKQETLKDQAEPFDHSNNYQKTIRFADENLKKELQGYIDFIIDRNLTNAYNDAVRVMKSANTEEAYIKASAKFKELHDFKDSKELAKECLDKAEETRLTVLYNSAMSAMNSADTEQQYKSAASKFAAIRTFRDAEDKMKLCSKKAGESAKSEKLFNAYKSAIQKKEKNNSVKALAEENMRGLTQRHQQLLQIQNNWNAIDTDVASRNSEIKTIQAEISRLKNEKEHLCFWAGKRKKEIASEIESYKERIQTLKQEIDNEEAKKGGFLSLESLGNEISRTEEKIDEQNKIILKASSSADYHKIREELKNYERGKQLLLIYDSILNAKVGDCIKFGKYQQKKSGEREDIEWLVLDKKNGKALVISKYALDCQKFNTDKADIGWETCTLRKWLNKDFINAAFSDDEKAMIPTVTVALNKSKCRFIDSTPDQVFLLSNKEGNKYFSSDRVRMCKPTNYAVARGVYVDGGNCCWWLRTPGDPFCANLVNVYGGILDGGVYVDSDIRAVRPAMWIDLNS